MCSISPALSGARTEETADHAALVPGIPHTAVGRVPIRDVLVEDPDRRVGAHELHSREATPPQLRCTPAPGARAAPYTAGSSGTRPMSRHRPTPSCRTRLRTISFVSRGAMPHFRSFPSTYSSPAGARNPATTVHPRLFSAFRAASRARMCCVCTGFSDPDRERNAKRSLRGTAKNAETAREFFRRQPYHASLLDGLCKTWVVSQPRGINSGLGSPLSCVPANSECHCRSRSMLHSESSGRFTGPRNEISSILAGGSAKHSARWNTPSPRRLFFPSSTQDAPVLQVDTSTSESLVRLQ